ncbi:disks large-associated protein 5 [Pseudomyrmex gracilis]|uniref:disks large-associated protein 5 n=1 Tax=Pseudomyrmex gracilis TaxID=219809 RepID=UPI0009949DB1|nr:disks large-associated protein 5 [Pseudomyrmex gracilis]
MPNFKQQYKNPRLGFGDAEESRNLRAYNHDLSRRHTRTVAFNKNRKLEDVSSLSNISPGKRTKKLVQDVINTKDERQKKLMKWKEERERKKKLEARNKKPPFKVGIVHHSTCSPVIRSNTITATAAKSLKQPSQSNTVQKRITRATEKRLQRKINSDNITSTSKHTTNTKKTTSNTQRQPTSFAPVNHVFRPPSGLQNMPLFGLVAIEETPQEKGDFFTQRKSKDSLKFDKKKQVAVGAKKLKRPSTNTIEVHTSTFPSTKQNSSKKVHVLRTSTPDTSTLSVINTKEVFTSMPSPIEQTSSKTIHIPISTPDISAELNESITTRLSLKEQTTKNSLQENTILLNKSDIKTPSLQRTASINTSSEKENDAENLIIFSPYITQSRGKKNARKEQQQRLGIHKSSLGKIPTKDTVMQDLNISVEDEERTAQYFKLLLNREVDRLQDLCMKWLAIQADDNIPEDVVYEIQQAVGQTKLLISKKFERFRGLVKDCEAGKGEMLVTCRDLQGFWDMTYMEVKDCDSRFEKLEQRQNRGWQEEEHTVAKVAVKKRKPTKKQGVSSKPSALRSMILAARKKKIEAGTLNKEDQMLQDRNLNAEYVTPSQSNRKSVIFTKDTNSEHSRRCKSLNSKENKSTPGRRASLRNSVQKVQFSTASKLTKSPFALMKISQKLKTPEVQLDDTITYINSGQTPGKGILKKSEDLTKDIHIKSLQKVNFDVQVHLTEVPINEETQTKLDLAAALRKIDALNMDEVYSRKSDIERKLNFESDSDDSEGLETYKLKAEAVKPNTQKSLEVTSDSNMCPLNDTTYLLSDEKPLSDDEKSTPEVRVLRNRTVVTVDTPKNRRSKLMIPKVENKEEDRSSIKVNRKKLKSSIKIENHETLNKENITKDEDVTVTDNTDKRRKSTRKSVAFNAEACLVCAENKPVLPVTPHVKRYSKRSSSKHAFDKDLISWDTPELPGRVMRSHSKKNLS